jgi:hypothetical protein
MPLLLLQQCPLALQRLTFHAQLFLLLLQLLHSHCLLLPLLPFLISCCCSLCSCALSAAICAMAA